MLCNELPHGVAPTTELVILHLVCVATRRTGRHGELSSAHGARLTVSAIGMSIEDSKDDSLPRRRRSCSNAR